MYLSSVKIYQPLFKIYRQTSHRKDRLNLCCSGFVHMPYGYTDSRHQLRYGKRLGKIIIRSLIKGSSFFPVLISCRDHNYRHLGPFPYFFYHIHPVHIGKSQIQQHQIRFLCDNSSQSALGSIGRNTGKPLLLQRVKYEVSYLCIIFHY